jgi:TRAP-type C4-dicarboxylate transport system substrate-binding protein
MASPSSRRRILRAAVGYGALLAAPHVARAAIRTLRITHNNPQGSHYDLAAKAFAGAVNSHPALSEAFHLDVKTGGNAGDELSLLKDCADGSLDFVFVAGAIASNSVKAIGLINAPFLFRDPQRARDVLDGPLGAEIAGMAKPSSLYVMAWGENGLRHITSNRPIRSAVDLKNLRIRILQSELMVQAFRSLGCAAAPLPFPQVREALRTGQFEAQENPVAVIEAFKVYEVQKYLCLTGHTYDPGVILGAAELIDDLKPVQRDAMFACAVIGGNTQRTASFDQQAACIERLAGNGMTVIRDVDIASLRTAALPFLQTLVAGEYGPLMQRLIEAGA